MNAGAYNTLLAVVIAVIIVLAMNLVGSLLISALVIFPALSAMRLFRSFKSVTICSVIISVICASAGIIISILAGTPVGSTIVAVDATACCAQGIEFLTTDEFDPSDYPAAGEPVTVLGTYDLYEENGYQYCVLKDAVLE